MTSSGTSIVIMVHRYPTDKEGVADSYQYDEWGLRIMALGRVTEGIGWIGDLNTGTGTPGLRMEQTVQIR